MHLQEFVVLFINDNVPVLNWALLILFSLNNFSHQLQNSLVGVHMQDIG